jgi:hypothetical protein
MGLINVALTGTSSHPNINDNNTSTYQQAACSGDGCTVDLTGTITFSSPIYRVTSLSFYLFLGWGGTSSRYGGYVNIAVKYGGVWHELPHTWDTIPGDIRDWGFTPPDNITISATGPWYNVQAVRAYLWGSIGGHSSAVTLRIREMNVWGYPYTDIGLRYFNGTNKRKILCKHLETTDKFRIKKGGTTYGIDIVPISDPLAGSIRVHSGVDIFSFPEEAI